MDMWYVKVEVNPCWQQKKLIQFCKDKGILVVAYAPLGAFGTFYGTNRIMESEVLKQIAEAKGKTVAQVVMCTYEPNLGANHSGNSYFTLVGIIEFAGGFEMGIRARDWSGGEEF